MQPKQFALLCTTQKGMLLLKIGSCCATEKFERLCPAQKKTYCDFARLKNVLVASLLDRSVLCDSARPGSRFAKDALTDSTQTQSVSTESTQVVYFSTMIDRGKNLTKFDQRNTYRLSLN